MLKDGKVVIATGKVDQREDEISFLVEKMIEGSFIIGCDRLQKEDSLFFAAIFSNRK